jgi:hypothetical protein
MRNRYGYNVYLKRKSTGSDDWYVVLDKDMCACMRVIYSDPEMTEIMAIDPEGGLLNGEMLSVGDVVEGFGTVSGIRMSKRAGNVKWVVTIKKSDI